MLLTCFRQVVVGKISLWLPLLLKLIFVEWYLHFIAAVILFGGKPYKFSISDLRVSCYISNYFLINWSCVFGGSCLSIFFISCHNALGSSRFYPADVFCLFYFMNDKGCNLNSHMDVLAWSRYQCIILMLAFRFLESEFRLLLTYTFATCDHSKSLNEFKKCKVLGCICRLY